MLYIVVDVSVNNPDTRVAEDDISICWKLHCVFENRVVKFAWHILPLVLSLSILIMSSRLMFWSNWPCQIMLYQPPGARLVNGLSYTFIGCRIFLLLLATQHPGVVFLEFWWRQRLSPWNSGPQQRSPCYIVSSPMPDIARPEIILLLKRTLERFKSLTNICKASFC